MPNKIFIDYDQSVSPGGCSHVLNLTLEGFAVKNADKLTIDFQHEDIARLDEPVALDGYVFGILMLAMAKQADLIVNGPVTAKALRNASFLCDAWHHWLPCKYRRIDIKPETLLGDDSLLKCQQKRSRSGRAIAAFSGGLGSTFSILRHRGLAESRSCFKLSDLVMVHGFDVPLERRQEFDHLVRRTRLFVESTHCNLQVVRTNIKRDSGQNWEHSCGAQLACILHQFSRTSQYGLIASSSPFSYPDLAWGTSPLTDYLLSGNDFEVVCDGAGFTRTEKAAAIANNPLALQSLKVCWEGQDQLGENCGVCEKCVRTKLNFAAVGLDSPACFKNSLDIRALQSLQPRDHLLREYRSILDYAKKHGTISRQCFDALEKYLCEADASSRYLSNIPKRLLSPIPPADFTLRLDHCSHHICHFINQIKPISLMSNMPGNIGDHLIYLGSERLLSGGGVDYDYISVSSLRKLPMREPVGTLVVPGSGAWTKSWHEWLPSLVKGAASQFQRIVILPSTYDSSVPEVADALSIENIFAFAREQESYLGIKHFGRASIAMDPAFYAFEFERSILPELRGDDIGNFVLSLRTDKDSIFPRAQLSPNPELNKDLSVSSSSLEEFIDAIRDVDSVVTDRLHVAVAGLMLGKYVFFCDPTDNKISRYQRYNLRDQFFDRFRMVHEQWLVCRKLVVPINFK